MLRNLRDPSRNSGRISEVAFEVSGILGIVEASGRQIVFAGFLGISVDRQSLVWDTMSGIPP
jgi:hypothetical protein